MTKNSKYVKVQDKANSLFKGGTCLRFCKNIQPNHSRSEFDYLRCILCFWILLMWGLFTFTSVLSISVVIDKWLHEYVCHWFDKFRNQLKKEKERKKWRNSFLLSVEFRFSCLKSLKEIHHSRFFTPFYV